MDLHVEIDEVSRGFLDAVTDYENPAFMQGISLAVWGDAAALQAAWGRYGPLAAHEVSSSPPSGSPMRAYSVDLSPVVGRAVEVITIPVSYGWEARGRTLSESTLGWLSDVNTSWPRAEKLVVVCVVAPCTISRYARHATLGLPMAIEASGLQLDRLLEPERGTKGKGPSQPKAKQTQLPDGKVDGGKDTKPRVTTLTVRSAMGRPIHDVVSELLDAQSGGES